MKVPVRWILLEDYAKQFQPAFPFNPLYQRWQWFGILPCTIISQVLIRFSLNTVSYRPALKAVNLNERVILMCRHRYA